MNYYKKYVTAGYLIAVFVSFAETLTAASSFALTEFSHNTELNNLQQPAIQNPDTVKLPLPIKPDDYFASDRKQLSPLFLAPPSNIVVTVEYDPKTKQYIIYEKVGNYNIRSPRVMSEEEYRSYKFNNSMREYWKQKQSGQTFDAGSGILPRLQVGGETFDRIFGSNVIEIIPQGNAELSFAINHSKTDNPNLPVDMRKSNTFDFKSKIQMNVDGKIGEKMKMNVQYNTEATFDFENNVKVEYSGFEDEIIQKIEAGNVSLPLPGTLITGSQSLFGFKTQLKFGKLNVTTIFSKQNGQSQVIEVKGGAQTKEFSLNADEYDANKHFFLSQYFRESYNRTLQNLPIINTGVNITKVEVWVTNRQANFENSRNIVAFIDIGESQGNIYAPTVFSQTGTGSYPDNALNDLYLKMTNQYQGIRDIAEVNNVLSPLEVFGFTGGKDYEKIENARKLGSNEYTINSKLGFISINGSLNADEVLAVAFEYTIGGQVFKVGELSSEGVAAPNTLILKLLKGSSINPKIPTWKLMMKNIYPLGAYQVSKEEFRLDVLYQNDASGTALNYISEGNIKDKPLISVLNLDNLNSQLDPSPDGVFDFIDGVTITAQNGKVIFPVLEPFGNDLAARIGNPSIAEKYIYQELYDSTLTKARQVANKNKFKLAGSYQSSYSSEISLNAANVPKGSVVVTAGGAKLTEGTQYTVDYNLGTVKIIDQSLLESGTPIRIVSENNALFNFQTKTLIGSHFDYKISEKFNVGATILNLTERPLTQKVNFGNEAISNTIWGLNTSFQTEASFITKMVDFLPFIQTKEKSTITFDAEFAQFIPGYSKAIGRHGTVYLDDFEGSTSPIEMINQLEWKLASTPIGQNDLFPEGSRSNDLSYGFNRAKVAWYIIDPLFLRKTEQTPDNIRFNDLARSSHWVREIFEHELFPNKNIPQGQPTNLAVLNVAFYPNEKGPYNFNVTDIDSEGRLLNPKTKWGGIMRPIGNPDFEAQNIEYIEFWLMDPFVYDSSLTRGGDLYFNLGKISEDILRDGKKMFEGGLPTNSAMENVDTTVWGRVPKIQSIPNNFALSATNQRYQDIGLDGLSSRDDLDGDGVNDEESFYQDYLNSLANIPNFNANILEEIRKDPSNDDYRYFLDAEYNILEAGILDRYKKYNNLEGNTPYNEQSNSSSSTTKPDIEDINNDQTMNDNESYFQYRISLRKQDMQVGRNFITNKLVYAAKVPAYSEKQKVTWYQFKVPISEYERIIGPIQDFKTISFARMFLRGFADTTILRFAKLQMVKGEWRKYSLGLIEGQEGVPGTDLPTGLFEISSVNIEDNYTRTPVNYVLPPGLSRTTDPSQQQVIEQNEQSMEYRILELAEGDARAGFKNVNLDIRQYRNLRMDIHAEAIPGFNLNDNDLTLFVRLGTDYTNNYYEYEIPLKVTPEGRYSNNREADRITVWPRENLMNIDLEAFTDVKLARNDAMHKAGSSVNANTVFVKFDGERKIKVTGNPSLSNVKIIMIGVRNPGKANDPNSDGAIKSATIWVNELRLSNTDDKSGWAANARLSAKLADLGMLTIAGTTIKPGFGSIESKVVDRTTSDYYQYDLSTTLEMGRFFPAKSGVRIPLYVGYSESFSNPEYNPLDPDVPLKTAIKNAQTKAERDSIKSVAQDYTRRKSINFTNVKIDKAGGKAWPLSISNFSVSYSFSEFFSSNIKTDHKVQRNVRGALTYNYNTNLKPIVPLKNVKWLNSRYLRLIKDFNFNPLPSQFSFRTDLNRSYYEQQMRNINNPNVILIPTYSKDFLWNRVYTLNWDLSQSLKFDFNANNTARIDEPDGIVARRERNSYQHWKDSVWQNILNFGRNTDYNHQFNATYSLPLSKIPFIDWTSASVRYTGNYKWTAGPIMPDTSNFDPGNTIQNSGTLQLNGQVNLITLFNKVGYLKRINQKFDQRARGGTKPQPKLVTVKYEEKDIRLRANIPKSINHNLKTENVTVKVFTDKGLEVKVKTEVRNDSRITLRADKDFEKLKVVVEGKVPEKVSPLKIITESTLRILMGVKSISVSYALTNGTLLPGYKPVTKYLGLENRDGISAPGLGFIAGFQDPEFAWEAIKNGWLSKDTTLSNPVVFTNNENLVLRTSIEPFPGFRLEVNANRTYSRNHNEYYHADYSGNFIALNPLTTGNFSLSVISIGTAFKSPNKVFDNFKVNRIAIANRLADIRSQKSTFYDRGNQEFPNGYSELSQDVLIPAFLATYASYSTSKVPLGNFPIIPFPNWQLTYDGLAKIKPFKNFLRTFTLTHGYRSVYTIGAFTTNLRYFEEEDGLNYVINTINDYIPQREINNISITEQFTPLIAVDMGWINSLTTRFEIKTNRSLSMSFANNQLTEINNWEYIIGGGYRFENLPLIFGTSKGDQKTLKSDLRLRFDFSLRKNKTVLHKLVEGIDTPISGQIALAIKTSADYVISNQVTVRAFVDWAKNTPIVSSSSFPMVNASFGFSLRFTMVQ
ncbi:MAG: cell surface protein SprA [Tenuifilaceae bacterium]